MKRVLITKLASLGDIVMALPALSDAKAAFPSIQFDWVVDKAFHEIPKWHPAVSNTFITNHRVWRKTPLKKSTRQEFSSFYKKLRENQYDCIIDAHGNFKTALLTFLAKGPSVGFNGSSTIEWGSHFFYQTKCSVRKDIHSIERLRGLFAQALNYPLPQSPANYQVSTCLFEKPPVDLPSKYLMFVPIASYGSKLWPEFQWKELIKKCANEGLTILIPWGNEKERQRALRLASSSQVQVLPRLTLNQIGYLIEHAKAVVSVDTGLSHMAASIGTPCLTLYGPTDPNITGTVGENQLWLRSHKTCHVSCKKKCAFQKEESYCLENISPSSVWDNLSQLLRYY
jgi:heptosyltransferase I